LKKKCHISTLFLKELSEFWQVWLGEIGKKDVKNNKKNTKTNSRPRNFEK